MAKKIIQDTDVDTKAINLNLNNKLYGKVKLIATILSNKNGEKVQINDLINEGMELIIDKYKDEIREELEQLLDN